MLVEIASVLKPDEIARCRDILERAAWIDGKATAGDQAAKAKFNMQIPEGSPAAVEAGEIILRALGMNPVFNSAALPFRVLPPLFNRYDVGMKFGLVITAPDGSALKPENSSTGKYRSTFDLPLKAQGTYRLAVVSDGLFASYELNGEKKRWRGSAEKLSEIPADAKDLKVTQSQRRLETFVTLGKPNDGALKPTGVGLELIPVSHPNDLFAGSEATFKLLLDGKDAPNLKVTVVRGGGRYRAKLGETAATTGADGKLTVTFPDAGMYWLEATVSDDKPAVKEAKERRVVYAVTLEVLPE